MDTNACFFSLLRAGLWGVNPDESLFRSGTTDWEGLFNLAVNQTVPGIVFDGVEKLPSELRPPRPYFLKWFALVTQIEQANEKLNHELVAVHELYRNNNVPFILLKGQGIASIYVRPEHRQCGDLDLYVGENYKRINKLMMGLGLEFEPETPKHAGFMYNGVVVENHKDASYFTNPFRDGKLQRFTNEWLNHPSGKTLVLQDTEIDLPAPGFNAIYLLVHSLLHLIKEGVGLRQVCDWARVLQVYADEIDRGRLIREIKYLKLEKAFAAFGYVAVHYLGLPAECLPFAPDKERGELLLSDILKGGNFGKGHDKYVNAPATTWKRKIHSFLYICNRCRMMTKFYPSEAYWYPCFKVKLLINDIIRGTSR